MNIFLLLQYCITEVGKVWILKREIPIKKVNHWLTSVAARLTSCIGYSISIWLVFSLTALHKSRQELCCAFV